LKKWARFFSSLKKNSNSITTNVSECKTLTDKYRNFPFFYLEYKLERPGGPGVDIEDQEEKEASDEVNAWRSNFFPCLLEFQNVFLKKYFS
jgi:hypothetical protein